MSWDSKTRWPALVLVGLLTSPLQAQDRASAPNITPDRPGIGDGAHVVAPGVWQLEAGAAFFGEDVRGLALGQGLLRWGLGPVEGRLHLNSYVVGETGEGLQDPGLAVKVPVGGDDGPVRVAAVTGLTLPIGTDEASARVVTGWVNTILETSLASDLALALNLGYALSLEDPSDQGVLSFSVTPSFPMAGWDGVTAYAGLAGFVGSDADDLTIEGGIARLLDPDTQFDVNAGVSLGDGASFLGVGIARRWR